MSIRSRLIISSLLLTTACSVIAVPTAAAHGGGTGGGGTPGTPPPTSTTDPCAPLTGAVYPDGTTAEEFNEYGIVGGCAVIVFGNDFRATVYQVLPQLGWSYRLGIRNQTNGSRVTVDYTEDGSGRQTSLQVEPGKTVVRQ